MKNYFIPEEKKSTKTLVKTEFNAFCYKFKENDLNKIKNFCFIENKNNLNNLNFLTLKEERTNKKQIEGKKS